MFFLKEFYYDDILEKKLMFENSRLYLIRLDLTMSTKKFSTGVDLVDSVGCPVKMVT